MANTNNEDAFVDHVADREFEVRLHDLGIPPENLEAIRRVEARLAERSRNAQQAAQAQPDENGSTLEGRKKLMQIGPLGQGKASQPMELRKKPTRL